MATSKLSSVYRSLFDDGDPRPVAAFIQRICGIAPRPERTLPAAQWSNRAARLAHRTASDEWHAKFLKKRPIVYFLTERLPILVERTKANIATAWYQTQGTTHNFFIGRSDKFNTGCKRWEYQDASESMLTANFNQFVDLIEWTCAHRYVSGQVLECRRSNGLEEEHIKWTKVKRDIKRYELLHLKKFRSTEYALEYLHTRMELKGYDDGDDDRRDALTTKFVLYIWWTVVRPNRGDPRKVSGLEDKMAALTAKHGSWTWTTLNAEDQTEYRNTMIAEQELQVKWDKEDTDMLVMLIKERHNIWN